MHQQVRITRGTPHIADDVGNNHEELTSIQAAVAADITYAGSVPRVAMWQREAGYHVLREKWRITHNRQCDIRSQHRIGTLDYGGGYNNIYARCTNAGCNWSCTAKCFITPGAGFFDTICWYGRGDHGASAGMIEFGRRRNLAILTPAGAAAASVRLGTYKRSDEPGRSSLSQKRH